MRRSTSVLLVAVAFFFRATARGVTVNHYVSPSISPGTNDITAGPDGNLWFTEVNANKVGRTTTAGVITEFNVTTPGSFPSSITAGPDGNLWFTERDGNQIGRMTTSGAATEFAIPTPGSIPHGITAGPDGNIWFAETFAQKIGRLTTAGLVTEFPSPAGTEPLQIVTGSDGNLWFTGLRVSAFPTGSVVRMTPSGATTEFPLLTCSSQGLDITPGSDGNLWSTCNAGIVKATLAGVISEFPYPTPQNFGGGAIASGPDGNSWYTRIGIVPGRLVSLVGRISPGGVIAEFPLPAGILAGQGIVTGPDGNIWFTTGDGVGQLLLDSVPPAVSPGGRASIPTLSAASLALLALFLGLVGWRAARA